MKKSAIKRYLIENTDKLNLNQFYLERDDRISDPSFAMLISAFSEREIDVITTHYSINKSLHDIQINQHNVIERNTEKKCNKLRILRFGDT